MLDHADALEQLKQHPPDEPLVSLSLTDDAFLRSSTWARAAEDSDASRGVIHL